MPSQQQTTTIRYTALSLALMALATGYLLENANILNELLENLNPSFLPGF